MMNRKLFLLMTILLPVAAQAQQDKKSILQGNEYYRQQQYDEAATAYQRSLGNSGVESVVSNFNLGAAWYKQKKLDDAVQQFTDIAGSATDKTLKAKAYHNLGNALLESQKLEESIEAYKKSLLNNPKDDETRYNLAYAQEKLKQQQQQNNEDQNKDNNQDQNKDNKNQNKDNKDQNKDQENKDNQDQNEDNKDQENKDQDPNKDNKDQDNGKNDQQQSQPGQLSKADAERLLEAMNQEEKNTQEKLKKKKATGQGKVVKQW